MINKYLEKIAQLSNQEVHSHGTRTFLKGTLGGMAGGMVPVPFAGPIGSIAGRAHELAQMKSKIVRRHVPMTEVAGHGATSLLRSMGRSVVEGVGGGGVGAALGAGVGALTGDPAAGKVGAMVGGGLGAAIGSIHGSWRSTHNSTADYAREWSKEHHKK